MGYNTKFTGSLKFNIELKASELALISSLMGEDCRDHPEWNTKQAGYIDLKLLPGFDGIAWDDGTEKTYGLEESVNVVIRQMQAVNPKFGLSGQLIAQGEDADDQWCLRIANDGFAIKEEIKPKGIKVTCPDCGHKFRIGESH